MNKIVYLVVLIVAFSVVSSAAQQSDDCYLMNKAAYEKLSFENYEDNYLKPKIEYYFSLDDTKPEPKYFDVFKSDLVNDTVVKAKTDNGYEIELTSTAFKKDKHQILRNSAGDVCRIDNKIFFGTDLNEPTEEIKSITVKYNNKKIGLSPSEYNDLFNPYLNYDTSSHIILLQDRKNDYLLLVMYASDAAGAYAAMWIFKNGKYVRRIVDSIC